jgi:Flp pilus assembly protein TadD
MPFRTRVAALAVGVLVTAVAVLALLRHTHDRRDTLERANARLERGMRLYHQKAYARAEVDLRRALRRNPDDWKAPFYVGVIQIERKRHGLAIPYLERALALNPREPRVLNALGVVYFKVGRLDMAKGYFAASLDLDPTNRDAKGLMETMAKLQRRAEQAASVAE